MGSCVYALTMIDDYSRMKFIYFLQTKDEATTTFKVFSAMVKRQKGIDIKSIRVDGGGEFINKDMESFCAQEGIFIEVTMPDAHQQHGVIERTNRSIFDMGRTLLSDGRLPKNMWAEATTTAVYILNRLCSRVLWWKSPYNL